MTSYNKLKEWNWNVTGMDAVPDYKLFLTCSSLTQPLVDTSITKVN